jgi:chromatin remodeling complex protein RSC6
MAPKTTKTTTAQTPAAAPSKSEKKTVEKKTASKKKEEKPVETTPAPVEEKKPRRAPSAKKEKPAVEPASDSEAPAPKERALPVKPTKESINSEWEGIIETVNAEMGRLRDTKQPKGKGTKFLKTLNKLIKQALQHTNRVTKFKKVAPRKVNSSSGFLKPVNISPALAAFTGWDVNQAYSRTAVTKFICEYVKKNMLFDQSEGGDKRNIIVDDKLKRLLNYDPKNPPKDAEGNSLPLTYFRLQQYLKSHFSKPSSVSVEDEELDEE